MNRLTSVTKYMILILFSVFSIFPFVWMLLNSVKHNTDIYGNPFGLPRVWDIDNYVQVWTKANLATNFSNSLLISVTTLVVTLLFGSMASYIVARVFKSLLLYTFFAIGIMIPVQTILIPSFALLKWFDLLNTRTGLGLIYIVGNLSLTIFILVAFMKSIPNELEEAAVIDGCTRTRTFFSIILPLAMPALATVGILTFLHTWNEYMFAYILISTPELKTITQGIYSLKGEYTTDYGPISAGLVISMVPVVLAYLIFQEQVVKGMAAGAVKG